MLTSKTLYVYNVNPSSDGSHKIHAHACPYTPDNDNTITLDFFKTVDEAVASAEAKHGDLKFSTCDHCSK